jgi:hypothetical protein
MHGPPEATDLHVIGFGAAGQANAPENLAGDGEIKRHKIIQGQNGDRVHTQVLTCPA